MSSRLRAVEVDIVSMKSSVTNTSPESLTIANGISTQLKTIESRCEDTENRLCRCNLLFFGITDDKSESWSSSESKVIDICNQHLGIAIDPAQIDCAHRLGQYNGEKSRPVIVKFAFFKDKQRVIEKGYKFKNTNFAVREDFSLQTRIARRKLIEFARIKNAQFKLTLDKLRIDNNVYTYDAASATVVPLPR